MKWWGWGDPNRTADLPESVTAALADVFGADAGVRRPPVGIDEVEVCDSRLSNPALSALREAVGEAAVRRDRDDRIVHAAGKGYVDLVKLRLGKPERVPDAVVYPGSREDVERVLAACRDHDVAIVCFGGGTSVVGGVEPIAGGHGSVITLDLGRMSHLKHVDRESLVATVEAGSKGPALEAQLARQGLTLGHFPQSFEFSSVGGWVATRSAGQASTGYGRIDELVAGLNCACPAGEAVVKSLPKNAAGPALREVFVGSEGVLGVITDVDLMVRPKPALKRYEGWMFRDFDEGREAFRGLPWTKPGPTVCRISDQVETQISLAMAGAGARQSLGAAYIKARGYKDGCVAIFGYEGDKDEVRRARACTTRILKKAGGLPLGQSPGRAWARERYDGPYLRDALMGRGFLVETLETATLWSKLDGLYGSVRDALVDSLTQRGTPPLVMCHLSHVYRDGASLYFTFVCRQEEGREVEQWRAAKRAATDAIVANHGTITHHHAVGTDHAPWIEDEIGSLGVGMIESLKAYLDPTGILNPGKLLPGGGDQYNPVGHGNR